MDLAPRFVEGKRARLTSLQHTHQVKLFCVLQRGAHLADRQREQGMIQDRRSQTPLERPVVETGIARVRSLGTASGHGGPRCTSGDFSPHFRQHRPGVSLVRKAIQPNGQFLPTCLGWTIEVLYVLMVVVPQILLRSLGGTGFWHSRPSRPGTVPERLVSAPARDEPYFFRYASNSAARGGLGQPHVLFQTSFLILLVRPASDLCQAFLAVVVASYADNPDRAT